MNVFSIFMGCLIFLSGLGYSFSMTDSEYEAQRLYLVAVSKGGGSHIQQAEDAYFHLLKVGAHPLYYKIRLASLTAMKARLSFWPHEKMKYVNLSIRYFDRLERQIQKTDDPHLMYEFYMYRGRTYSHFPAFLKKTSIAMEDMKKAVLMAQNLSRPKEELGPFYLEYSEYLKKYGDLDGAAYYAKQSLKCGLSKSDQKRCRKVLN